MACNCASPACRTNGCQANRGFRGYNVVPTVWTAHAPHSKGWECPRCGTVWNPDKQQCDCKSYRTNVSA